MKTLVQLLIAALVVNAAVRAGMAAWEYYEFRDAVEQEARFARGSAADLHRRIIDLAFERGLALDPASVIVEREGDAVTVAAPYDLAIPLVPRLYTHRQRINVEIGARIVRPITVDDLTSPAPRP